MTGIHRERKHPDLLNRRWHLKMTDLKFTGTYSVDMLINFKKCSCIRFGSRCNITCENIVSSTVVAIQWSKELRCPAGVTLVNSCTFKCNLDLTKKFFYRRPTANAIIIIIIRQHGPYTNTQRRTDRQTE